MSAMNRREFLAVGAVGTAGYALENKARVLRSPEKPWNASSGRALRKYRDPLPTACCGCRANCSLLAFRDGDRVVQLGPNPDAAPVSALCARAYQMLESLYDPERVRTPLRRRGARGEGKWEAISWKEALAALARPLAEAPSAACVDVGRPDPLAGAILATLGVRRTIEDGWSRQWGARKGQEAVYGMPLARPDFSRARTILLLGARPLDDDPAYALVARDLIEARSRGASIIAVGSYEGVTGSLATEWIPVRPGTEALVALALVRVVLSQGWFDAEAFARTVGMSPEALIQELLPYKLELVEPAAGIPVLSLVRLARKLAFEGPTVCVVDSAGRRQARELEAAGALLSSLRGNPEVAGLRLDHRPSFVPRLEPTTSRAGAVKDILAGNERASLYLAYRSNPVYRSPRSEWVKRTFTDLDRIGLLVAVDTQLTETAELADLVLPAASDLELWNLLGGYTGDGRPYAVLQQPAPRVQTEQGFLTDAGVGPDKLFDGPGAGVLGEAKQLGDILRETLMAGSHPARDRFPRDCGAEVRRLAESIPGGAGALVRKGAWVGDAVSYPWAAGRGFATPSRRLQVGGLSHEVPEDLQRLEGKSFALVVLREAELSPGYANSRWGREIRYRNPLLMNAASAERMGLAEGDRVVLRSDAGETTVEVLPIEGIHPQAVALADDFGHWAGGVAATARRQRTGDEAKSVLVSREGFLRNPLGIAKQTTQPGEVPWWSEHGPGASVWGLSPFTSDDLGAQAWREIRVTVQKA